ncbi:MAG: DUF5615 family PIN-like protein [Pseudomonadota bacterium]
MRLLLDESVPRRLRQLLPSHDVRTVVEMGWSGVTNGKLLVLAAKQFDAFVTVDQNLPYQQNMATLPVSVIVLAAASNDLNALAPLVPTLEDALLGLVPRTVTVVQVAA